MQGCKYITTLVVILAKDHLRNNGAFETEYVTLYFNSLPKLVINKIFRDDLNSSFEEIINKIQNWIKEGSGWKVESISSEYVNIGKYAPLTASSYIELPASLKNSKKGLINLRNENNKCFLWCHVRHLNPEGGGKHPSRITKEDKIIADKLDYSGIKFPVSLKDYPLIEDKFKVNVNVFGYNENEKESTIYPVCISKKSYNDNMDLLIISDEKNYEESDTIEQCKNKSYYVYIKDFNRLMYSKSRHKTKKYFCKRCLQCFSSEEVLNNHKGVCLMINGQQSVKKGEGSISFTNHCRQIPVPFKIYADFECILEKIENRANRTNETSSTSVVCVDDKFTEDAVVYRGKDCVKHFINQMLTTYEHCMKIKKRHFNKILLMSKKDEQKFQASDKCWICGSLFDETNIKVRDHCHISGKFRGTAHQSCNIKYYKYTCIYM